MFHGLPSTRKPVLAGQRDRMAEFVGSTPVRTALRTLRSRWRTVAAGAAGLAVLVAVAGGVALFREAKAPDPAAAVEVVLALNSFSCRHNPNYPIALTIINRSDRTVSSVQLTLVEHQKGMVEAKTSYTYRYDKGGLPPAVTFTDCWTPYYEYRLDRMRFRPSSVEWKIASRTIIFSN